MQPLAQMSLYQFDRRMRQVFGLTPGQWILKLRIDFAQQELRTSDDSIAQIALNAGAKVISSIPHRVSLESIFLSAVNESQVEEASA